MPSGPQIIDHSAIIPEIYNEKPEEEAQWWKIHLRGTDDLSTEDLIALAQQYEPDADVHIQWVNDTSANIVCKGKDNMQKIFLKLVDDNLSWDTVMTEPFTMRMARQHPSHPATMLQMRVAQAGDRKRKNAAVESRYYLMHPDEDPTERIRQEFNNHRGEYRRRRYDDRENRRRRDQDHTTSTNDFSASMYDDAPSTDPEPTQARGRDLFSRISRRRSASPGTRNSDEINISDSENESRPRKRRNGYRDRTERPPPYSRNDPAPAPKQNLGKELFSSEDSSRGGLRSDKLDLYPSPNIQSGNSLHRSASAADNRAERAAVAKRLKADLISAAQTSPRIHHRRSHAMDAKNAEDLAERFARKNLSIDSTKSYGSGQSNSGVELFPSNSNNGISIRGSADQGLSIKGGGGLSIKGRAMEAKELFPQLYKRTNEGKELFDEPIREKRVRRRAGDLFD